MTPLHPRDALFEPEDARTPLLPVCDHYSGVEARMRKSLSLQGELGPVFDVTLDLEDGAPAGGEVDHALLVASLLASADNRWGRVGVRMPPVGHARFGDVLGIVLQAARPAAYLMLPKVSGPACVDSADAALRERLPPDVPAPPLHALVETHAALHAVHALAAHPRIESLSFGLMDFVSAHQGAIPFTAMSAQGQFDHPLVRRAKLEIAAACHAHGKVPSHSVITEIRPTKTLVAAAERACREFGYLRMWSIHPDQIRPIVEAFTPSTAEVDLAIEILHAAQAAGWGPIRHRDTLHDRASFRYFWRLLQRAHATSVPGGEQLPAEVRRAWFDAPAVG